MFHPIAPRFYHGKGAHTGWSKLHFDAWQRGKKKQKNYFRILSNFQNLLNVKSALNTRDKMGYEQARWIFTVQVHCI